MAFFVSLTAICQFKLPSVDKSPLDISYYPINVPHLKIEGNTTEPPIARVIYSRPKKEGRPVFGGLVEYGKLWRLGANEATEIEFYRPVVIVSAKNIKMEIVSGSMRHSMAITNPPANQILPPSKCVLRQFSSLFNVHGIRKPAK